MSTFYSGNLAKLRDRRSRLIAKRLELRRQQSDNIPKREQCGLHKKIYQIGINLDHIESEIKKTQKGMKNSNRWMDGTYNSIDL